MRRHSARRRCVHPPCSRRALLALKHIPVDAAGEEPRLHLRITDTKLQQKFKDAIKGCQDLLKQWDDNDFQKIYQSIVFK